LQIPPHTITEYTEHLLFLPDSPTDVLAEAEVLVLAAVVVVVVVVATGLEDPLGFCSQATAIHTFFLYTHQNLPFYLPLGMVGTKLAWQLGREWSFQIVHTNI
jgi:hypothetical protein